jgi:hypothetical protein
MNRQPAAIPSSSPAPLLSATCELATRSSIKHSIAQLTLRLAY